MDIRPQATHRPVTGAAAFESRSPQMRRALAQVRRFARHDHICVLLEGDRGCGKTMLAHHIHQLSPRANREFRSLSLAATTDELANSDLFGHVRGAFTGAENNRAGAFASAAGGSLFLDEVGKASRALQMRLLRVVEGGEFFPVGTDRPTRMDVRLIFATNESLDVLVDRGEFLPDLRDRLAGFSVRIPTLRERQSDIPQLVKTAVADNAWRCGYPDGDPVIDDDLMRAMQNDPWPGNVRQLIAAVMRIMIDAEGALVLSLAHCMGDLERLKHRPRSVRGQLTRAMVDQALTAAGGSKTVAAEQLGVSRKTVYEYLSYPCIESPPDRPTHQQGAPPKM